MKRSYKFIVVGAGDLMPNLGKDWTIALSREQVSYFATPHVRNFIPDRFPVWIWHGESLFYGFPDMPPDRDFILDTLPGHPRITFGMGAAPAAKFASLIGGILADLAIDSRTAYPIDSFRADRLALTDPDFTPAFRLHG